MKKFTHKNKKFAIDENTSSVFCIDDFGVSIPDLPNSKPSKWKKEFKEISPQLQLCISMSCNLDCRYCVFRKRELENNTKMMTMRTAIEAIDLFFKSLSEDQRFARIDFGVAGEPFIAEGYHKILKDHIKKLCKKFNKTVWVGANMSNGLIFTPDKMVKRLGSPMDISIDGVQEDHDKFRRYKNKKGTYNDLAQLIQFAIREKIDIGACSVITAETLDISKNFKHIFDLGIKSSIYMKPVNSGHEESFALNEENLPKFKQAYSQFIDFLLASSDDELAQYLKAINPEDYFFRYFYRILNRSILRYRCNCGKSGLYVDWDGKLYPCAHFVGAKGQDIGSIEEGVSEAAKDLFMNQTVENRKPCNKCWARYLCGGGCYYQGWLVNKTVKKPDGVKCQLIKHFIKLQSYFISELIEKRRGVLEKLGNPYFSGAINAVPPQGRGAFSPRIIGRIGQEEVCVTMKEHTTFLSFSNHKLRVRVVGDHLDEINILIDKSVKHKYQWDEICFYKDVAEYEKYTLRKKRDLVVHEHKQNTGFIEVPFKDTASHDTTGIVKEENVLEFPIPVGTQEIGFNITINDKNRSCLLVPEIIGILAFNKNGEESTVNPMPSRAVVFGERNKRYFPLWIKNSSSSLFSEDGDYAVYDSSVC
ncbi:MAG: SPASM domain-containing protein [bacterium]|nr:SPASM domain-containing protein [bacterium]